MTTKVHCDTGDIVTNKVQRPKKDENERCAKLTITVLVATIDAQWEGMGDVG